MSDAAPSSFTNRLAGEKSPYLRQHAHNPVDWYPWGEAAFARARAEQKPIFLSVGYSTCHWCHVMAHESFEKVDREERPDVDRVYMAYVQAATGQGGWPMNVWLTPELQPFHGGTYFPPEDRWGRPGFASILGALARSWDVERDKLVAEGERVTGILRQHAGGQGPGSGFPYQVPSADGALRAAAGQAFEQCFQVMYESFDPTWGGFGSAPKFPRPAGFNFLFRCAAMQGMGSEIGREGVHMATYTLRKMAEGGMHDHVGGGFHRYSVDAEWLVPHFEKMLYDQAQLAVSYLEARQSTGDERFAWVARGIFDYVLRDLAGPDGGFYSAEDADSRAPADNQVENRRAKVENRLAEGAFYVWTRAEINERLGGDAELFGAHFGVTEGGNVPEARDPQDEFHGKNLLRQRQSLAATARQFKLEPQTASDRLGGCLERLRTVRNARPRPSRDDKVITAWNGMMISALAKGHQVLGCDRGDELPGRPPDPARPARLSGDATCLKAAIRAAEFTRRELYDEARGTLYRSWRDGRSDIDGFAEDYACLIQGLLDLYEASFEIRWLRWAERLQAKMDELFWDAGAGGYFDSRANDPTIIVRLKEDYDGAEPAPSSVAAMNLLRLSWMLEQESESSAGPGYADRARKCFLAFTGQWKRAPHALPQMLSAVELALEAPRTIVFSGDPQADDFAALAAVVHERLGPRRALLAADGGEAQRWLAERMPYLADMKPVGGRATAYVCEQFTCRRPVSDPAELRKLLG